MVLLLVADVLSHDLSLRFWDALAPGQVFVPPASRLSLLVRLPQAHAWG